MSKQRDDAAIIEAMAAGAIVVFIPLHFGLTVGLVRLTAYALDYPLTTLDAVRLVGATMAFHTLFLAKVKDEVGSLTASQVLGRMVKHAVGQAFMVGVICLLIVIFSALVS